MPVLLAALTMRFSLRVTAWEIAGTRLIESESVITVTTKTGNKTVTLTRNGVDSNILNRLVSGSTWLTLKEGTNIFRVEAVRGVKKLRVTLMHRNSYLGV